MEREKQSLPIAGHWRGGSCAKLMPRYFSNTAIASGTYRPQCGMCVVFGGAERGSWHGLRALATCWPVTVHPKGSERKAAVPDAAT
ncbi:uncharacterized [Tachysurus ichikawai]